MSKLIDVPNRVFQRFCERVDQSDTYGCWPWTGAKSTAGYGQVAWQDDGFRFIKYTHRLAWSIAHGPIPDGLEILHSCDNPPCCNPAHLSVGTHDDNMKDAVAKGRASHSRKTHCKNGHPFDSENTYFSPRQRICRTCHRESVKRHARKKYGNG